MAEAADISGIVVITGKNCFFNTLDSLDSGHPRELFKLITMSEGLLRRISMLPTQLIGLSSSKDIYNGLTILPEQYAHLTKETFEIGLSKSIEHWSDHSYNGIWFKVNLEDSWLVPILVQNGFIFHHAQPDYLMLTKWLPGTPCTLPKYPFTTVGAGGLVVRSNGDILLIKERKGMYLGWKLPGGVADPGEEIGQAAQREVLEETGITTEFVSLLGFRHATKALFKNTGDIYFVCVMKPKDDLKIGDINPCPHEVGACQWMSRQEIDNLPEKEFHAFNRLILQKYDELMNSGRKPCAPYAWT
uniref:Nudix hydrolase domain-containing protein n=1 Tax=Ditylenchus dipsaci TaxID=166011 RepID=A0A915EPN0_9BILA